MEIECKICKVKFDKKPSKVLPNGNCCSKKCSSEDRKPKGSILSCSACGETFYRTLNKIKENKTGFFFCSKKCQASVLNVGGEMHPKAKYGGKSTYRKRAIEEYGAKCTKCGYDAHEKVLDVHHIDEDRNNNLLTNLIVLCPTCHMEIHRL